MLDPFVYKSDKLRVVFGGGRSPISGLRSRGRLGTNDMLFHRSILSAKGFAGGASGPRRVEPSRAYQIEVTRR